VKNFRRHKKLSSKILKIRIIPISKGSIEPDDKEKRAVGKNKLYNSLFIFVFYFIKE
jgi:hypothetical protein